MFTFIQVGQHAEHHEARTTPSHCCRSFFATAPPLHAQFCPSSLKVSSSTPTTACCDDALLPLCWHACPGCASGLSGSARPCAHGIRGLRCRAAARLLGRPRVRRGSTSASIVCPPPSPSPALPVLCEHLSDLVQRVAVFARTDAHHEPSESMSSRDSRSMPQQPQLL